MYINAVTGSRLKTDISSVFTVNTAYYCSNS